MTQPGQPSLLQQSYMLLQMARMHRTTVLKFIMNARTMSEVAVSVAKEDRASVVAKVTQWIVARLTGLDFSAPPKSLAIAGVPVEESDKPGDGVIMLEVSVDAQPDQRFFFGNSVPYDIMRGLGIPAETPQTSGAAASSGTGFQIHEQAQAASESVVSTESLLVKTARTITPTDVLIKAMEDIDKIRDVVVIRVHHSMDVDVCMSCEPFATQGILQAAQIRLAHG